MAVSMRIIMQALIDETLGVGVDSSASPILKLADADNFKVGLTLDSTTTPPVTEVYADNLALSGGAITIDLTALPGTNGRTIDMTGLKVQYLWVGQVASNTANLTLKPGASTGYNIGNNANTFLSIGHAGNEAICCIWNELNPDVSGSLKHLDVTGAGSETFNIVIAAG